MSALRQSLLRARETLDFEPVLAQIPYARFLGISVSIEEGEVIGRLAYGDHIVGNPKVDALHGGTLGVEFPLHLGRYFQPQTQILLLKSTSHPRYQGRRLQEIPRQLCRRR